MKKKDKEQLLTLQRKGTVLGVVVVFFNFGVLVGLFYALAMMNILMAIPFMVLSAVVNQVAIGKMSDILNEANAIKSKKPKPENTMMEGLKADLKEAKEMVTDRYFWKLVIDDIKDAFRAFKNK